MSAAASPSLEGWVETINKGLGTGFTLEEPGQLFMEFGGDLRVGVEFPEGASHCEIYAPIGFLNDAAHLPRLLLALELNLHARGTAGGVIGLDLPAGAFVYSSSFPVEGGSAELLASRIESFLSHARRLRATLEAASGDIYAVELENLAEELGMVRESDAEDAEAGDGLGAPPPTSASMIRV